MFEERVGDKFFGNSMKRQLTTGQKILIGRRLEKKSE